ncbi:MAG: NAD-dependent epimerase/dehydratase family protein, partial [Candidatus Aminicenantes bacterium]|nr:NAD-dependent epimerase/dehydratase family protein [Candidatus Aminicenantes bacterium]
LVEFLLARPGTRVVALVRDPSRRKWLEGLEVDCLRGDLQAIPPLPPDIDTVFHLAGATKASKPADYYTVNQKGTASLFEALTAAGARSRVVVLSSLAAAGPSEAGRPNRESDPARPVSAYGRSKLEAEREALRYKDRFPVVILRVGPVYGPRDAEFLDYFKLVRRGLLPRIGPAAPSVSVCHVRDLVEALWRAGAGGAESGSVFNIADPLPVSWDEIGRAAARAMGRRVRPVGIPKILAWCAAWAVHAGGRLTGRPSLFGPDKCREMTCAGWTQDVAKAEAVLGFRAAVGLEDGIRETIAWYRERGWL